MTSTQIAGLYAIRGLTHGYGRAPTRSELCEHMATYLRASRGTVNRVLDALARRRRIRMNGNSIELLIDGGSP